MSDTVRITGVHAEGRHGVHEEEKARPQPFLVDVEAEVEAARAAAGDDLADTVSYADIASDAVAVVRGPSVDLIETLAQRIADRVLARGALRVAVTVHKPEAPVGLPFSDASGTIRRAVVALGANLGDARAALDAAVEAVRRLDVCVTAVSRYTRTAPVLAPGQPPQPDYLNAVLTLTTAMSPLDLLAALQRIEVRLGRVRRERWGPRAIDLDIVDVEGVASRNPRLTLPHPLAAGRLFVLEPWAEIEPDATLAGSPVASLAAAAAARSGVCA